MWCACNLRRNEFESFVQCLSTDQANLLIEQLMQQKNCVVHTKALPSHYLLKIIRKSPKGQMWTCNAKEIMWVIIFHTIIANSKIEAHAQNISHALTKEKSTVDILNILTIPIGVGEKGRGLHATGAKWHLIMAFFCKPKRHC